LLKAIDQRKTIYQDPSGNAQPPQEDGRTYVCWICGLPVTKNKRSASTPATSTDYEEEHILDVATQLWGPAHWFLTQARRSATKSRLQGQDLANWFKRVVLLPNGNPGNVDQMLPFYCFAPSHRCCNQVKLNMHLATTVADSKYEIRDRNVIDMLIKVAKEVLMRPAHSHCLFHPALYDAIDTPSPRVDANDYGFKEWQSAWQAEHLNSLPEPQQLKIYEWVSKRKMEVWWTYINPIDQLLQSMNVNLQRNLFVVGKRMTALTSTAAVEGRALKGKTVVSVSKQRTSIKKKTQKKTTPKKAKAQARRKKDSDKRANKVNQRRGLGRDGGKQISKHRKTSYKNWRRRRRGSRTRINKKTIKQR
jgi:hypothetical protein